MQPTERLIRTFGGGGGQMAEAGSEQVALERLLAAPEAHAGRRVATTGRLVSVSWSEFWLVAGKDDVGGRRAARLVHPDLDVLLFDNVPSLGGSYAFYHPATVAGVVRLDPLPAPGVELGLLSTLVITTGGRTYELIGGAGVPDAEHRAAADRGDISGS